MTNTRRECGEWNIISGRTYTENDDEIENNKAHGTRRRRHMWSVVLNGVFRNVLEKHNNT